MCGRAAQTRASVTAAASLFGVDLSSSSCGDANNGATTTTSSGTINRPDDNNKTHNSTTTTTASLSQAQSYYHYYYEWTDNFNLSPGMDAMVFYKNKKGDYCADRKVWGLVTQRGTPSSPLPVGMAKHFQQLMFNARSDTLYEKPTFGRLASSGKSCIIALDGFFEWKAVAGGKKQPYFVQRRKSQNENHRHEGKETDASFLLMAGLWNQVPTGWENDDDNAPATLDTFTIITTEVCQPLSWLHSRMPLCVWDVQLARQWLDAPTAKIHGLLDKQARETPETLVDWYKVTTEMSSTKFRSPKAIKPLPKEKSVKDYFMAMAAPSTTDKTKGSADKKGPTQNSPAKRKASDNTRATATNKRGRPATPKKKGPIDSFFKPKTAS